MKIFTTFLDDTPRPIQRLREACAQNRADALRRKAHTLRGPSLNLRAHRTVAMCRRLETEPLASELPLRVRPEIERELSYARML